MTTDRGGLSGGEWRLILLTALGAVYAAAFLALAEPGTKPAPAAAKPGRAGEPRVAATRPAPARRATRIRTRSS